MIEAIYENGVFRPLGEVNLPEGSHVNILAPELRLDSDDPPGTVGDSQLSDPESIAAWFKRFNQVQLQLDAERMVEEEYDAWQAELNRAKQERKLAAWERMNARIDKLIEENQE